jgi:hypothetical protein
MAFPFLQYANAETLTTVNTLPFHVFGPLLPAVRIYYRERLSGLPFHARGTTVPRS